MAGQVHVKVGGVWKEADDYYVKVGGVWKTGTEIHTKVSSTWEGGAAPSSGPVGLPTASAILGFDLIGFAAPINTAIVDAKYGTESLKFDVIGFAAPITGGMPNPDAPPDPQGCPFDLDNLQWNGKAPLYKWTKEYNGNLRGIYMKPDGTAFYTVQADHVIRRHDMSVAYDISTTTYNSVSSSTISSSTVRGISFKSDGTVLYYGDSTHIRQKTLGTAWDITTLSSSSTALDFSTQNVGQTRSFTFKPDGTKLYIAESDGSNDNYLLEFTLSSAWNLSTASYVQKDSTTFQGFGDGYLRGLSFSTDGTKLITSHSSNTYLYQYDLGTAWDISTLSAYSSNKSYYQTTNSFDGYGVNVQWKSDGTIYYMPGAYDESLYQFEPTTPWRVPGSLYEYKPMNDADYTDFVMPRQYGVPQSLYGCRFNSDGTKLYFIPLLGGIQSRNLTSAYDIKTLTSSGGVTGTLSGLGFGPKDFMFNSNGTKLLVGPEIQNKNIKEYTLSTGFDLSTISLTDTFAFTSQMSSISGGAISDDGIHIYASYGQNMYQYTMTTPFDVSTASYIRVHNFGINISAIRISPDGTQMIIYYPQTFTSFTLGTAWDISTETQDKSFDYYNITNLPSLYDGNICIVSNGGASGAPENGWYHFPYYCSQGFKVEFN